jgi:uncharacterized protein (DUF58 family)
MAVTGRGYGLLVAGVALLLGGFLFGYPELAALGAASLAACAAAVVFVAWRPRLTVERVVDPDRVTRGDAARVRLRIGNASRFFGASVVARDRVESTDPYRPGVPTVGTVPVPLVRLRPGRASEVHYPVPTSRRGVVEVGPLEITRRDPLGLVGVVRRYGATSRVWVHPRSHALAAVPVGLSRSMDGRVDRVPHGSITFAALREYVVGDDLRQVHWRTSARVGELMVREHVDTSLPRIVLLLDDRAGAHTRQPPPGGRSDRESVAAAAPESTFEAVCEAAASVLLASAREDVHVELRMVAGDAAGSSEVSVGPLLDLLAEATLAGEPDERDLDQLRRAAEKLRVRRTGDTLIFLTGPPDDGDLGVIAGLRGAYPSIITAVFGPVETGLATTANLLVVGAADGADFAGVWDGVRAW